ncbi:hypothetical protein [Parasedimentitalea huanghaiensis]|uniref:Cadmium transporter n=1 Tax=Parasedimentitalea huanghaiensis TaxID=2682100 RepID=A0A6L6W9A1_9RHOB|nr:hypothetical protein [Zongyanglinia huanghaiensis]MVO14396.1 hypothetical protein [Zongyanglinia huanghaiensis]
MWDEVAFAASAALAQIVTNLDNLAVLLVLLVTMGAMRPLTGYALSQGLVLGAAMVLAFGTDQAAPEWTGYLGTVPILLGVHGLWHQWWHSETNTQPRLSSSSGILGVTALFLALSLDSFAVMAPLLADSAPGYRLWALAGASSAVAVLCAGAVLLSDATAFSGAWAVRLERLGPVVMILIGAYVLINSGTDLV